jgi:Flp pilus assembly protein TadD
MHRNSPMFPPLLLLLCLVFQPFTLVHAQKSPSKSQSVAPVIFLDSTKEQDGLIGPVRRVQTETVKLDTKTGSITEGPRQMLEVTTYNLKGERIDNLSYPVAGPTGTEEYKYDDKGNVVEMTLRGKDGSIISREVYSYEADGVGNWIKMTTSLVLFEDGKLRYEPVETTYRTIAYFYDETIAKLLDAHSTAAKPSVSPAATDSTTSPSAVSTSSMVPSAPAKEATEPNHQAGNPSVVLSLPQPSGDPAPGKVTEEVKTTGAAEGTKVDRRADSSNSRANQMEVPASVGVAAVNSLRSTPEKFTPSSSVKESAAAIPEGHKRAFDLYKSGREQFGMGNLEGAIQAYQQALEIEPGYADVYLSLGHAYVRQKKDQEAIKALKEAVRFNPEMDEAYYGLGLGYFRLGKMKEAAQAFKKTVALKPSMAKAHYGLALAYQDMGKQELLLEEYRILQTLDSQLAKKLSDSFPEFNLPCGGRRCD